MRKKKRTKQSKAPLFNKKASQSASIREICYLSFRTSPKWMLDDSRELISIRSATDMPYR